MGCEELHDVKRSMLNSMEMDRDEYDRWCELFREEDHVVPERSELEKLYTSSLNAIDYTFDVRIPFDREFKNIVDVPSQIEDVDDLYNITRNLFLFVDRSVDAIENLGMDFNHFFDGVFYESNLPTRWDVEVYDFMTYEDYKATKKALYDTTLRFSDGAVYHREGDEEDIITAFQHTLQYEGRSYDLELKCSPLVYYDKYVNCGSEDPLRRMISNDPSFGNIRFDHTPTVPTFYLGCSVNDYDFQYFNGEEGGGCPVFMRFEVDEEEERIYPDGYCVCFAG